MCVIAALTAALVTRLGAVMEQAGFVLLWEIPSDYTGWVFVQWATPDCPALDVQGIIARIPINTAGCGCTSSPYPAGWRYNIYEHVHDDGSSDRLFPTAYGGGGAIWAPAYTPSRPGFPFTKSMFFVGTEQELQQSWRDRPLPSAPVPCAPIDGDAQSEQDLRAGIRWRTLTPRPVA